MALVSAFLGFCYFVAHKRGAGFSARSDRAALANVFVPRFSASTLGQGTL